MNEASVFAMPPVDTVVIACTAASKFPMPATA